MDLYLTAVAYGNGLFVAVGKWGAILTSPDGETWTEQASPTGNPLFGVTYGNGTFVAVGDFGIILTPPEPEIPTPLPRPIARGAGHPYPGPGGSGRASGLGRYAAFGCGSVTPAQKRTSRKWGTRAFGGGGVQEASSA
jgi:hypothetical protein